MGRQHQPATAFERRCQRLVPKRHDPVHRVFEALAQWHLVGFQAGVTGIAAFAARISRIQRWRRRVVAAPPGQHLGFAILPGHVGLVESLQGAVMPLVEPPAVHHRQPSAVHLVEHMPQGAGGALEHAGVSHIKIKTGSLEQPPGVFRLL